MELKEKFIRLGVLGGQEFIVKTASDPITILNRLNDEDAISLKLNDQPALFLRSQHVISVQEVNQGAIGQQTRVWSYL